MADNGAYRIYPAGVRPRRSVDRPRRRGGRHRLGHPHLRHCRELRSVRARLASGRMTRHAAPPAPAHLSGHIVTMVLIVVALGTILVSGWYAAAGAAVIANMVAP